VRIAGWLRSYALSIAGWLAFGALLHWHEHHYWMPDEPLWPGIATSPLLEYGPYALLWPVLVRVVRASLLVADNRRLAAFAAVWFGVTTVHLALGATLRWCCTDVAAAARQRGLGAGLAPWLVDSVARGFVFQGFLYAGLVGTVVGLLQRRATQAATEQAAQLREQLLRAQLDVLRSRLQPHFLFNALHAIAVVARRSADEAERMLTLLGDLLRRSLTEHRRDLITLEDELRALAPYIELQRIRFQDRLRLEVDVPGGLRRGLVPDLLLQPLVENALQHGIERRAGPGTVTIAAHRHLGRLTLCVADDGAGLPADTSDGIGIGTTRERLHALFGAAAQLVLRPRAGGGTEVLVHLPWSELPGREAAHD
jgi:Histidine kinase/Histidine kinase-, DNA gyrase B-, and HSP90-like ATPase